MAGVAVAWLPDGDRGRDDPRAEYQSSQRCAVRDLSRADGLASQSGADDRCGFVRCPQTRRDAQQHIIVSTRDIIGSEQPQHQGLDQIARLARRQENPQSARAQCGQHPFRAASAAPCQTNRLSPTEHALADGSPTAPWASSNGLGPPMLSTAAPPDATTSQGARRSRWQGPAGVAVAPGPACRERAPGPTRSRYRSADAEGVVQGVGQTGPGRHDGHHGAG